RMDAGTTGILILLLIFVLSLSSSSVAYPLNLSFMAQGEICALRADYFWQANLIISVIYPQLVEKYGPIFTVWLGSKPAVVLCGYEVTKDALVGHAEEFGGRPDLPFPRRMMEGGICTDPNSDLTWRELRKFTLTTLREFGMGKRTMSERIQKEAHFLVEAMADMKEAFEPNMTLIHAVANVICSVLFGSRFNYKDKDFLELLDTVTNYINYFNSPIARLYSTFPGILSYLPGVHNRVLTECEKLKNFIQEKVEFHKRTLDPASPRDCIDCFLIQSKKEKSTAWNIYTDKNLIGLVFSLFGAGTVSTSSSLLFCLLVLVKYPHIQAKIHQEIDEAFSANHVPSMEDRVKLPYTNAVIHEVQRYQPVHNENFPREVTRDTVFWGYTIPKGTPAIPMLDSVHTDPVQWETPKQFNLGHFLDENGHFRKREAFIPFSAGKRACPGEGLAQMELFLFLTILLQNFIFKAATEDKDMDVVSLWSGLEEKKLHYKFHLSFLPKCRGAGPDDL
uniref:Cytochrome P450 2C5-like n=1 Tax=Crocodylus porosus TaxID=8502 RepID=A0A7M4FW14_CROPO